MVASTEYRELSNFDIQCFTSYHLFGCERQFHGKQSSESILVQDPLSLIAAGAAIGGAAGKFTERAWDVGERWLKRFFLDHAPAANQAARANAARFILELGQCIRKLEDTQLISREAIDNALNNPQFSIILQRAVLGASQTEDAEKSRILAELVTARLTTRPESAFALAVRLACDAVAASNADQLRLLALATALHEIRPRTPLPSRKYHTWLQNLLVPILTPYADEVITYREIEVLHLAALGCVTYARASERDLETVLAMKNGLIKGDFAFDFKRFKNSDVGACLDFMWTEGFAGVNLTSVGSVIGGVTLDGICGIQTGMPHWVLAMRN